MKRRVGLKPYLDRFGNDSETNKFEKEVLRKIEMHIQTKKMGKSCCHSRGYFSLDPNHMPKQMNSDADSAALHCRRCFLSFGGI